MTAVDEQDGVAPRRGRPQPGLALGISLVVYLGYSLNAFVYVWTGGYGLAEELLAAGCLIALMALQAGVLGRELFLRGSGAGLAVLAVQAALVYLPLPVFGWVWLGTPAFLAGSVLLVLRRAVPRWTAFVVVCLLSGVLMVVLLDDLAQAAYVVVLTAGNGIAVYGMSRLTVLATRLRRAEAEITDMSVRAERDRFTLAIGRSIGSRITALESLTDRARAYARSEPAAANALVERTIRMARDSQAQVRSTAHRLRSGTLHSELDAVRTVLSAAGVEVEVDARGGADIPAPAQRRLEVALRAVAEDVVRHEDVRSCRISVEPQRASTVRLVVTHDGRRAVAAPDPDPLHGIAVVTDLPDGARRVEARVSARPDADDGPSTVLARAMSAKLLSPRVTGLMLATVLASQVVIAISRLAQADLALVGLLAVLPLLAVVVAGHAAHTASHRWPRWVSPVALSVQVVAVLALALATGAGPSGLFGVAAAGALIVLPRRWNVAAFVLLVISAAVDQAVIDGSVIMIVYGLLASVNIGLSLYGLSRLGELVAGLHEARTVLARAAALQERSRFARDLHDLFGYSFSAAVLKAELALRLLTTGNSERATRELADVCVILQGARADLDGMSGGARALSLDDELASVRSTLASAGVETVVDAEDADRASLPPEIESEFATVVREGVANLLRHSDATTCWIRLSGTPAEISIGNDGVRDPAARSADTGNGLVNLRTRIERCGGAVAVDTAVPGRFTLRARVPGRPSPGAAPSWVPGPAGSR